MYDKVEAVTAHTHFQDAVRKSHIDRKMKPVEIEIPSPPERFKSPSKSSSDENKKLSRCRCSQRMSESKSKLKNSSSLSSQNEYSSISSSNGSRRFIVVLLSVHKKFCTAPDYHTYRVNDRSADYSGKGAKKCARYKKHCNYK